MNGGSLSLENPIATQKSCCCELGNSPVTLKCTTEPSTVQLAAKPACGSFMLPLHGGTASTKTDENSKMDTIISSNSASADGPLDLMLTDRELVRDLNCTRYYKCCTSSIEGNFNNT